MSIKKGKIMKKSELKALILECKQELAEEGGIEGQDGQLSIDSWSDELDEGVTISHGEDDKGEYYQISNDEGDVLTLNPLQYEALSTFIKQD
jgi:hypothetical protein